MPETMLTAAETLRRMRTIAENEMFVRGAYISDEVVNEHLAEEGAVCHGHQACAIGSLWLAYGIEPVEGSVGVFLPCVGENTRSQFTADKPELRKALDALNEEAEVFMDENDIKGDPAFDDPIESLFESDYYNGAIEELTQDMKAVIDGAIARVSA